MVADLPDDTVAAFGFSPQGGLGRGDARLRQDAPCPTRPTTIDEQLAQFESETGLAFPEDIETLLGEGVTISVGSGIDPDAITNGGPGEVPAGITIKGDADEIQAVLDKISGAWPVPRWRSSCRSPRATATPCSALQDDYRGKLEAGGDLGDTDDYAEVVESDDAQSVLYVNFDADDDWLVRRRREDIARGQREPRAAVRLRRQRLGRRRRHPRHAQAHHRLTGRLADRSATDGGGHRSGDRHQVGRCELEVEAAPAARHEDRRRGPAREASSTVGCARFWPTGEMPPAT